MATAPGTFRSCLAILRCQHVTRTKYQPPRLRTSQLCTSQLCTISPFKRRRFTCKASLGVTPRGMRPMFVLREANHLYELRSRGQRRTAQPEKAYLTIDHSRRQSALWSYVALPEACESFFITSSPVRKNRFRQDHLASVSPPRNRYQIRAEAPLTRTNDSAFYND